MALTVPLLSSCALSLSWARLQGMQGCVWAACDPAVPQEASQEAAGSPAVEREAPQEAARNFRPSLNLQQADVENALLQTLAASARLQLGGALAPNVKM